MKVRLFGGDSCPICELALLKLECEKDTFEYEYIDAFADEVQTLCDQHKVEELPHIQIFDDYEKDKIIAEFVGPDVLSALRDICD
jgi:hypothetical protein